MPPRPFPALGLALGLAAALSGCTSAQVPGPARADGETCVALYRYFDLMEDLYPNNQRRYDNRVAPPLVEAAAQRVRNAGCITLTRDLEGMAAVASTPVVDAGPAIRPISVHAGVVTNMEDDARSRAFFEAHGVRARSLGSAPLGRRIYVGPVATQGALDSVMALAVAAGFASPYTVDF